MHLLTLCMVFVVACYTVAHDYPKEGILNEENELLEDNTSRVMESLKNGDFALKDIDYAFLDEDQQDPIVITSLITAAAGLLKALGIGAAVTTGVIGGGAAIEKHSRRRWWRWGRRRRSRYRRPRRKRKVCYGTKCGCSPGGKCWKKCLTGGWCYTKMSCSYNFNCPAYYILCSSICFSGSPV